METTTGMARMWWVLALRGVLAVLFGGLVFFWPSAFWFVVVVTFAAYAILDGGMAIAVAITGAGHRRWGLLILEGVAGIVAGILALAWPAITELVLLYIIAGWAIVTGALEIAAGIQLHRLIPWEWVLIVSGALSIVLGVLLALFPLVGLLVVALWVGAYSVAFGVLLLVLAFRLRSLEHEHRSEAVIAH